MQYPVEKQLQTIVGLSTFLQQIQVVFQLELRLKFNAILHRFLIQNWVEKQRK